MWYYRPSYSSVLWKFHEPLRRHKGPRTRNLSPLLRLCVLVKMCRLRHRRSQDFFLGCTFLLRESWRPFLVVALETQAKTTKLSILTVQISPISSKNGLLLCMGVHALPEGALTTFPFKFVPKSFSSLWGCTCTRCTPWLRLWTSTSGRSATGSFRRRGSVPGNQNSPLCSTVPSLFIRRVSSRLRMIQSSCFVVLCCQFS